MRSRSLLMCVICVLLTVSAVADAGAKDRKKDRDYTKHPGYVDFNALEIFGDEEATVEVYLRKPMLDLLREIFKHDDPELYRIFGKLQLVRVQVFKVDSDLGVKFDKESTKTVKALDKGGWERVVRVKEDEERVFVYLKPSEDYEWIQGIVVIAMEEMSEAVFVNIVGDIHPDDIGRLGGHFGVDELDSIRYEVQKGN